MIAIWLAAGLTACDGVGVTIEGEDTTGLETGIDTGTDTGTDTEEVVDPEPVVGTVSTTMPTVSATLQADSAVTLSIPWEDLFVHDGDVELTYTFDGDACGLPTAAQEFTCDVPGVYDFNLVAAGADGSVAEIPVQVLVVGEMSDVDASSFLMAASFGPTEESIGALMDEGYSSWYQSQLAQPLDPILERTIPEYAAQTDKSLKMEMIPRENWYRSAVFGEDQLRQRAAFALSQIFVVSTAPREWAFKSHLMARYMDIIQEGAFGNFRDLLEEVTYSPMMGQWLTYIGNQKADPSIQRSPDENYAREIMQLFTIGLNELNIDGTPVLGADAAEIETYTMDDITELAKVFTGLWWSGVNVPFGEDIGRTARPNTDVLRMEMFEEEHSPFSKSFLGHTIPAGIGGDATVMAALDILFSHQNVAPFIGKQLIQRMTTSNPSPDYVRRVAEAFNNGQFMLPDGDLVGSGERGDMESVWAAILFDAEALDPDRRSDITFGKVREPVIRLAHWARVAEINHVNFFDDIDFKTFRLTDHLHQDAFRSPSVFNFYRPGYVAAGTSTAQAGLVAPELQITHTTSIVQYVNFMREMVFRTDEPYWTGTYSDETFALAEDADALADKLNLVLTAGRMTENSREQVIEAVESIAIDDADRSGSLLQRMQLAVLLVVTSQEYVTQH